MSENKPKLLVIYNEVPENIYQFTVLPVDKNYDFFLRAHGCLINSSDEKQYDSEIVENLYDKVQDYIVQDWNIYTQSPKELSGDYKIIHCGFLL